MTQANELVGRTIGEFQIERLLGQSQLGVAYRAQHVSLGHKATVTMFNLPADILPQEYEHLRERFARDGEALIHLTHPHILPIYAYGIQQDYVYLITAFVKEASLAQFLKQNVRVTPQQALPILKQLADGLDYAHSKGIAHGMLSLSNVMMNNDFSTRIAGFGLRSILDIHRDTSGVPLIAQPAHEHSSFLLGNAEYIAPERLMGQPIDARADIYALGVMLFVLLSGIQPFQGTQPLDIALQRLRQPVPSLHSVCPDISEAFDLVIGRALERDPARRLQSAGELTTLFERVLTSQDQTWTTGKTLTGSLALDPQMTLPPTINWFDEQALPDGQWQKTPPLAPETSNTPAFSASANPNSISGSDPFAWLTTTSTGQPATSPARNHFPWNSPVRNTNAAQQARRPDQQGRRRVISLITIGTVAAGVTVLGVSLTHLAQSARQPSSQIANNSSNANNSSSGNTGSSGSTPSTGAGSTSTAAKTKGTAGAKGKATPQPTTSKKGGHTTPTAQPTAAQATPTPAPPAHTGTVIGSTGMATNSSKQFTNPKDGQSSLLIRLANGNFVAYERACTHEGVPVDYDSGSRQLVCPAHNAIFDPANGGAHTSGPGGGSLPTVNIRVNADGTITTG